MAKRAEVLASKLDLDDVAIDPAPFQLVKGTSLYKVDLTSAESSISFCF